MHIPVFAVRLAAKTRAKAPLLLAINGGVLVVKACYDFYKAAPKCKEIMDEYRAFEEEIENSKIAAETKAVTKDYTEKDAKRDHAQNMLRTAIAFAKVFAPGAIDLLAAFGSFGYSYKILNGRYVAVAARSASQSKYIDHLEKGIMAAYGVDALHKIQHGDPEAPADVGNDGEAVSEEDKEIPPRKPEQILFTDGNPNFEDDPFKNRNFIVGMQNRLNDVLVARQKGDKPGWLTLNEIKTALGEPITGKDAKGDPINMTVGQIYGLLYWPTEELNKKYGGGLLDFGLDDVDSINWQDAKWRFKNGFEASVLLDVNLYPYPITDMI